MKKALVAGCSYTYGQELVANPKDQNGDFALEQSPENTEYRLRNRWVSVLLEKLGASVLTDLSSPGSSNDKIFRTVTNRLIIDDKPDVVVVGWSYDDRTEFYDKRDNYFHQFQNNNEYNSFKDNLKFLKQMYYNYNFEANVHIQKTVRYQYLLAVSLKALNIPFLFCNCADSTWGLSRQSEFIVNTSTKSMLSNYRKEVGLNHYMINSFNEFSDKYPRGPGGHPLAAANLVWADELYNYVSRNNIL